jgi:hypothetical protein
MERVDEPCLRRVPASRIPHLFVQVTCSAKQHHALGRALLTARGVFGSLAVSSYVLGGKGGQNVERDRTCAEPQDPREKFFG